MATKKQKTATSRKKTFLLYAGVTLLVLAGIFGVRTYIHHQQTEATYRQDKVRFAAAEKDMSSVYTATVASLGKPYETYIGKSCSYGALKFARGPLSCGIGYNFSYGTNSRAESKVIGQKILKIINDNYGFSEGSVYYGSSDLDTQSGQYVEDLDNDNGLSCELNFDTYDRDLYNSMYNVNGLVKNTSSRVISVVSIGCNGYTPKAFYQLEK